MPDPRGDLGGSRPASAGGYGRPNHHGDLPAGGGGSSRRNPVATDDPARLRPSPHGLPGTHLDRLGHLHEVLQGRGDLAGPSRVHPDALLQRPRVQPEPGGDGGPSDDDRSSRDPGRGRLLPGEQEGHRGGRRDPRVQLRRHGPCRRTGDLDLPGYRPRGGGHVEGGGRARLSGRRERPAGVVGRWTAPADAVVVLVQPDGGAGFADAGNRGERQGVPGGCRG